MPGLGRRAGESEKKQGLFRRKEVKAGGGGGPERRGGVAGYP